MPCISGSPPSILLAFADAVGYGVEVGRHHVQLVGLELRAHPGTKEVLVAVIELDDNLFYAVGVHGAPPHVERAAPPLPVVLFQRISCQRTSRSEEHTSELQS